MHCVNMNMIIISQVLSLQIELSHMFPRHVDAQPVQCRNHQNARLPATSRDMSLLALPDGLHVNCPALPASNYKTRKCHRSGGQQTMKQSMTDLKVSPTGLRRRWSCHWHEATTQMVVCTPYDAFIRLSCPCMMETCGQTSCTLVTRAKSLPTGLYSDIADVLSAASNTIDGHIWML